MPEITLVIGSKKWSSWSLRAWLALKHTGQPFEEIEIALRRPDSKAEILRHSPSGKVPILKHRGLVIWDSLAIAEYLAETFPEARLWPEDPAVRALARAVSAEMHSSFTGLRSSMSMDLVNQFPGEGHTPETDADIARIASVWRSLRQRFGDDGPYLFGAFSIADCMYAPVVTRFDTYDVDLDPVCRAYAESIHRLPSLVEWTAAAGRSS